jgi:ABC-type antimicrobial peptide transport system permease subunit
MLVPSVVLGLLIALGGAKLVRGLFYGVSPTDTATYALVAVLLVLVGLAACYIPARRASRASPLVVLRGE